MSANDKLFVEEIRNHSEIYDYHNVYFWNKARKRAIWDKLNLKFKVNAKKKWNNIRGRYCHEKLKIQQNKQCKNMWSLYPTLQFLDQFLKKSYENPSESKTPNTELITTNESIETYDDSSIKEITETSTKHLTTKIEYEYIDSEIDNTEVQSIIDELDLVNKCGQIFLENEKFIILCEFCLEKFNIFDNYMNHILIDHNLNKNESLQVMQSDSISTTETIPITNSTTDAEISEVNHHNVLDEIFVAPLDLNADVEVSEQIVESEKKNLNINDINILNLCHLKQSYECKECITVFDNNYTFYTHNKNLHPNLKPKLTKTPYLIKTDYNNYVCSICHHYFQCIRDIRVHHRKDHIFKYIQYNCNQCEKSFRDTTQLKFHMNVHNNLRPYKCQSCDSSFTNPQYLREHIKIHTGNKKHSCGFCEKKFISSSTKKYHEKTVHQKVKLYQCEDCGETFPKNSILLNHKNHKHNPNYIRPKYECDICHIKIVSNYGLKKHKFLHEGKKPYKCDICYAKFSRQSSLIVHKKIHSDIKSYVCDICGKKFAQSPGLYSHMKSHGTNLFSLKKK